MVHGADQGARLLRFLLVVVIAAWLAFGVTDYLQGDRPKTLVLDVLLVASHVLLLGVLQRAPRGARAITHLTAFLSTGGIVLDAWWGGGANGISWWFLPAVPLLTAVVLGVRAGALWAVLAGFALMTAVSPPEWVVPEFTVTPDERVFGGLMLIAVCTFFAAVSQWQVRAHAKALERARAEADSANRLKSALVANVSHELRTPLGGILGSAELLTRSGLETGQGQYVEAIESAGEALLRLVNDLLDVSRLKAGGVRLENEPFELRRTVGATLGALGPVAEARGGARLLLHVDAAVPEQLIGDAFRLRQVLTNLVSNAIRFTDDGYVLTCVTQTGPRLRFEVRDTGVGIAKEDAERLFAAFEQADTSTARRHGGTGLGLAIARQLVELMGGALAVDSVVGEGSCFWFELPFEAVRPRSEETSFRATSVTVELDDEQEAEAVRAVLAWADCSVVAAGTDDAIVVHDGSPGRHDWAVRIVNPSALGERARREALVSRPIDPHALLSALRRAQTHSPVSRSGVSSIGGGGRVLVADDTPLNRKVMIGQLRHLGLVTVAVEDGRAAVREAAKQRFDAIFLDVEMPHLDGYEAARAIRAAEQGRGAERVPLYALTAHRDATNRSRAAEAGFDRYLVKPLRIADLDVILGGAMQSPTDPTNWDEPAWEQLVTLSGDSTDFLRELVQSFLKTAAQRVATLQSDSEELDIETTAHSLHGAAAQMGALELASACAALERDPRRIRELAPEISALLERARTVLEKRVAKPGCGVATEAQGQAGRATNPS